MEPFVEIALAATVLPGRLQEAPTQGLETEGTKLALPMTNLTATPHPR